MLSLFVIYLCNHKIASNNKIYLSQKDSIRFVKSQKEISENFALTSDQFNLNTTQKDQNTKH